MRPVALALAFSLCGCNFAVTHPAITGGIVAGTVALGSCELAASDARSELGGVHYPTCFAVAAVAGVGLALITGVALWLGSEDEASPDPNKQRGTIEDPTNLEPAPVFVPRPLPKREPPPPRPEPEPVPEPPTLLPDPATP